MAVLWPRHRPVLIALSSRRPQTPRPVCRWNSRLAEKFCRQTFFHFDPPKFTSHACQWTVGRTRRARREPRQRQGEHANSTQEGLQMASCLQMCNRCIGFKLGQSANPNPEPTSHHFPSKDTIPEASYLSPIYYF